MQAKTANMIKRIVDAVLTVLLLLLMAFQVTGNMLHEWLGIGMTATLILHNILNRKWYKALFKGKYTPYRITMTAVNTLLLISIAMTAFSGMSMSGHAVPFMYGLINVMTARELHLAMSHWSFILMGLHIGLHIKAMTARMPDKGKLVFRILLTGIAGVGLWLFLKNDIANYIFFRTHFAFLDFTMASWLVILQNLAMLLFFVLAGYVLSEVTQRGRDKKYSPKSLLWLVCAIVTGVVMFFALKESTGSGSDSTGWQASNSKKQSSTVSSADKKGTDGKPAAIPKAAGFEDLMKLMEAESENLRNSLNDK